MTNNKALIALICGICGLFIPLVSIAAIILGVMGLKESKKTNDGRGMAMTGLILGIVASVLMLLFLLLLIVGGIAFFGVLDPSSMLPERTSFQAPIPNTGNAYIQSDGSVSIPFRNNRGLAISVTGEVSGTNDCADAQLISISMNGQVVPTETSIENGEVFTMIVQCDQKKSGDRFSTDISFAFQAQEGPARMHTGSVQSIVS